MKNTKEKDMDLTGEQGSHVKVDLSDKDFSRISCRQFLFWVSECGFPLKYSLLILSLMQLKAYLLIFSSPIFVSKYFNVSLSQLMNRFFVSFFNKGPNVSQLPRFRVDR